MSDVFGSEEFREKLPKVLGEFQAKLKAEGFSPDQAYNLTVTYFVMTMRAAMTPQVSGPHAPPPPGEVGGCNYPPHGCGYGPDFDDDDDEDDNDLQVFGAGDYDNDD